MSIPCGLSKPHPSHNFMFARTRRRCPGIDAPVAPDSEALDYGIVDDSQRVSDCNPWAMKATAPRVCACKNPERPCVYCREVNGSGVVPDKPALDPDETFASKTRCPRCSHHKACFCSDQCGEACCGATLESNASVPAVTDDEAATDWPLIAAFLTATHGIPEDSQDDDDRGWAIEAISGLRSAGFLIVHHTKET